MNNDNKHIDWDELIARYLAGEADADEIKRLEVWVKDDPAHVRLFNEMRTAWELSSVAKENHAKVDTESALTELLQKIDTKPESTTRGFNMRTFYRYAAAVVAIISIGYSLFWYSNNAMNESYVAGNNVVESVLPDGSVITLNQNSKLKYNKKDELERKVKLEGEAFFNVERMPSKPFIVETAELVIEVLGTSFYINSTEGRNFT
ncbi:MAG: FecR domain-containing protein, partial [Bacteroidota bacterium]|nr:FecR domain-containing protein [Bacteroidota bacterium]